MMVNVRLSADMANILGTPRLSVPLQKGATVTDLITALREEHPALQQNLNHVVPIISGQHVSATQQLFAGQEVALLRPIAGG